MLYDDLSVFYRETDFAWNCTRERPGESDVTFQGIKSTEDGSRFDGQLTAGVSVLRYPTEAADLAVDDVLRLRKLKADGTYTDPIAWRVIRTPERLVDGAESQTFITPDPEA